jgi:eukaryotic-like serine/threonine-protein kinase
VLALFRCGGTAPKTPVIAKLTSDSGWSGDPVFSPDGTFVLYSSDRGIDTNLSLWRIPVTRGEPTRLTEEPFDAVEADIAPDASQIVYRSRRSDAPGLYLVPAGGGPSRLLVQGGSRPHFSPDGRWIVYTVRNEQEWSPGKIYVIPTEGAAPRELATNFADAHYAIWSSSGKAILFCGTRISGLAEAEHDWWVMPFPTGQPVKTNVFPSILPHIQATPGKVPPNQYVEMPSAWVDGWVYFASPLGSTTGVSLWRLRLDPESPEWNGKPVPERLTASTAIDQAPKLSGKQLVYSSGAYNVDLWSVPLNAKTGESNGQPQRLVSHPATDSFPYPSRDGRYLAFASDRGGMRQIHVRNLTDQTERLARESKHPQDFPVISNDGKRLAFRELRDPKVPILMTPLENGEPRVLCEDCGSPTSWSPDDRHLLFEPGATIAYVGRLNVSNGQHEPWLTHPERSLRGARYSPDGRWIAFYEETGKDNRRLWLARADRKSLPPEWTPLTNGNFADVTPTWSPDGSLLYFLSDRDGHRCVYALRMDLAAGKAQGEPFAITHHHGARRSLLRLTRSRLAAVGLSVLPDRMIFAMDEQTSDLYLANLP